MPLLAAGCINSREYHGISAISYESPEPWIENIEGKQADEDEWFDRGQTMHGVQAVSNWPRNLTETLQINSQQAWLQGEGSLCQGQANSEDLSL